MYLKVNGQTETVVSVKMGNIVWLVVTGLILVTVHGKSMNLRRTTRTLDSAYLINRLLRLDCSPPPRGYDSGYGSYGLPRPDASRCHLWVDRSGYCRINRSHVITMSFCRNVIGNDRYNSLPRYGPGEAGAPDWDGGPPEGK